MSVRLPSFFWGIALASYCLLLYFLSDQSMLPVPYLFDSQDKLIHAVAYAGMAFLFWQLWRERLPLPWLAVSTVLFCSLYGISDEWHQSYVTGRDASILDWVADTTGAFLLTMLLYRRLITHLN